MSQTHMFGLIDPEKMGTVERVTEGVAMLHAFANVAYVYGRGGVLVADVSSELMGRRAVQALRELTNDPVRSIVYTHGHVDHVGGAPQFLKDVKDRGDPDPQIWAHEGVLDRFARYRRTWAWNNEVNRRQFAMPPGMRVFPESFVAPTHTYRTSETVSLDGEAIELHHARGETDDATWLWLKERRVAIVGDLIIHSIPNAGNPNKPQRYTLGWAEALEAIAEKVPLHLLPGHGPPVSGDLVLEMLKETARALRFLHDAVVDRLNAGKWPDEIVSEQIQLPEALAKKVYLQPLYGCPEYVIRDVLRAYAGWWDGRPEELMPTPRSVLARDLTDLAGTEALLARAAELLEKGEPRRALHLASLVVQARPEDQEGRALTKRILDVLASSEPSFIARSFYSSAAAKL